MKLASRRIYTAYVKYFSWSEGDVVQKRHWLFAIACSTSLLAGALTGQERPVKNRPAYVPPTLEEVLGASNSKTPQARMRPTVGAPVLEPVVPRGSGKTVRPAYETYNDEGQYLVEEVGYEDQGAARNMPQPVPDPAPGNGPWNEVEPPMMMDSGYNDSSPYHAAACDRHGCDGCGCASPCDAMGGACGTACCGSGDCLGIHSLLFSPRNFYSVDMLLWWRRGQTFSPLATTGPANANAGNAGVLPAATVLFGGSHIGDGSTTGLRVEAGRWLDNCHYRSLLFRIWGSGKQNIGFFGDDTQFTVLARPFFNVTDNQAAAEAAQRIIFPNQNTGSLSINGTSEVFGGDFLFRRLAAAGMGGRMDWVLGYQQMRINEDLLISSTSTALVAPNATIDVIDSFDVQNTFHGAAIGMQGYYREGPLSLEALLKVGLGNINREVDIAGQTTTTVNNVVNVANEGLLARATNIGNYSSNKFAAAPEIQLALGYQLTRAVDFTFGYSFLSVGGAYQPSRVIDRTANLAQAPVVGAQRPAANFTDSDYWVQGIHFGLNWNW